MIEGVHYQTLLFLKNREAPDGARVSVRLRVRSHIGQVGESADRGWSLRKVWNSTTTTDYVYDGLTLLSLTASRSDGATWTISYLVDEVGRPYAALYSDAALATPLLVHLVTTDRGDVVSLLNSTGTAFGGYSYDPWGNPLTVSSRGLDSTITTSLAATIVERQPLRYAGYAYDSHSGLYYLSQRYYDPATRQFITKDPARDDGEESAYQYAGGDPVGKVDPSGLAYIGGRRLHVVRWTTSWSPVLGGILLAQNGYADVAGYATWSWDRYSGVLRADTQINYKTWGAYDKFTLKMLYRRRAGGEWLKMPSGSGVSGGGYSHVSGRKVVGTSGWIHSVRLIATLQVMYTDSPQYSYDLWDSGWVPNPFGGTRAAAGNAPIGSH